MSIRARRLRKLINNFLTSPDDEHEMSVNRVLAGTGALTFAMLSGNRSLQSDVGIWAVLIYLFTASGIALHIGIWPHVATWRRHFAMALDVIGCSLELHLGGSQSAWLSSGFLWIAIGNGVRFGQRQLFITMATCVAGFATVAATTLFWQEQTSFSAGVLLGLIIIPLYTSRLLNKLKRARSLAMRADEAKSLFLAKVSHQLRTPLNAIIGFGALLADGPLDQDQSEMTQTILTSGRDLLSLIDGILDLARLESGKPQVDDVDFDLDEFLNKLRRMVLVQAESKGLNVVIFISSTTPLRLRADVGRIREILLNLLSNAVKFTSHGVVMLAAEATENRSGLSLVRFQIDDTGIGIPPEAQDSVFDMFTQADDSIANRYGGSGLGLSIARQLTELLGGRIALESKLGVGTTVSVELPVKPVEAASLDSSFQSVRCFIVSDPDGISDHVNSMLIELGATVERIQAAPATRLREQSMRNSSQPHVPALIAVSQSSASDRPYSFLAQSRRLHFFAVSPGPSVGPSTREQRRSVMTVISSLATRDDVARALRICIPRLTDAQLEFSQGSEVVKAKGFTVLIAEDNRVNQKVMSLILERAGFNVAVVDGGEAMLDRLERGGIDLALVDVNMAAMGGIEATQLYRVIALGRPQLPIVGVTADVSDETRKRCLDAGMIACVHKPVEPSALVDLIKQLLPNRPTTPAQETSSPKLSDDGSVRSILSHPRFKVVATPTMNPTILDSLRQLGGDSFVVDIIDDFTAEADGLLQALRTEIANVDVRKVREILHALRSSAVNIGARLLCDMLESWEEVTAEQIRQNGRLYLADLAGELSSLRRILDSLKSGLTNRRDIGP